MPVNGINPNAAIGAYQTTQRISGGAGEVINAASSGSAPTQAAEAPGSAGSVTFADLLENKIEQSVQTVRAGEEMSAKAITGEADLTDVVQAVTDAELTLQTLVAVRDKMISAYQEIMRMQI